MWLRVHASGDFAALLQGGFEIFDDFLSENVGIGKIVALFEALRQIMSGFVASCWKAIPAYLAQPTTFVLYSQKICARYGLATTMSP
jgi:hypothetical protein